MIRAAATAKALKSGEIRAGMLSAGQPCHRAVAINSQIDPLWGVPLRRDPPKSPPGISPANPP
jgi:hypothetical protein